MSNHLFATTEIFRDAERKHRISAVVDEMRVMLTFVEGQGEPATYTELIEAAEAGIPVILRSAVYELNAGGNYEHI